MNKTLNIVFGLCSLLGLIATVFTFNASIHDLNFVKDQSQIFISMGDIYRILVWSLIALLVIFLTQSYFYNKDIDKLRKDLGDLPGENKELYALLNHHILVINKITYNTHSVSHFYRYISLILKDAIEQLTNQDNDCTSEKCEKICNQFETFLNNLLSSINSTLSTMTRDNCSTCIKLVKDDKIKTYYRDSLSYRSRKESDRNINGNLIIYNISSNYAFHRIADDHSLDTFFVCDDLTNKAEYFNGNSGWRKLYNATLVVPVQADLSGSTPKRKIHLLAFLCCDNMAGRFEQLEIKDFLASFGDLLYNLLTLYDRFYQLSLERGFENGKLHRYGYWNNNK